MKAVAKSRMNVLQVDGLVRAMITVERIAKVRLNMLQKAGYRCCEIPTDETLTGVGRVRAFLLLSCKFRFHK